MRKKTGGGSRKGIPNKSTQEIKELLDSVVDFEQVIERLYELSQGLDGEKPDSYAAKILLEYRFGKPLQEIKQENEGGLHIKITRE